MRCPNCQTINPPEARFCLECGRRLVVCPHCGTVNVPAAKFCIECGTALVSKGESTEPLLELVPPTPMPQEAVNAESKLTPPEERRVVTIMFADIIGSTPLADRLDPEDMRAILVGYFNLMTEQIRRHGGTVEKYIGDAVMAVFGLPQAHEDDPGRAIRAALDMQGALTDFNQLRRARDPGAPVLQMRIGVNTGDVAAPGGQFQRQDFLITGDAVNVAARLQQVAQPDTILVGERTYLATRESFNFQALAPLQLKGKNAALKAWSVLGLRSNELAITQNPRGIAGLSAPLVGRELELTLMHATFARVRDARHSHLITLLGTPGVGKTRLVQEFLIQEAATRQATGVKLTPRVLQGHCPPYGEGITYWPLVEVLRGLIQAQPGESGLALEARFVQFVQETLRAAKRGDEIERVAGVLLKTIGRGLRGEGRDAGREIQRSTHNKETERGGPQASLQRACRTLLEAMAVRQPIILVIDDLQWGDDALLNLLTYLTGHISEFPVLFICLARTEFLERDKAWGGGQPNFTTIILDALSSDETNELVGELLCWHELPDVLLHTIQSRSEGNPFFIEELVRMLIDQGILVDDNGCWKIGAQSEEVVSELASPATPPSESLLDRHYQLP